MWLTVLGAGLTTMGIGTAMAAGAMTVRRRARGLPPPTVVVADEFTPESLACEMAQAYIRHAIAAIRQHQVPLADHYLARAEQELTTAIASVGPTPELRELLDRLGAIRNALDITATHAVGDLQILSGDVEAACRQIAAA